LLEPDEHSTARACEEAIHADGIPAAAFHRKDIQAEYRQLAAAGVSFRDSPVEADGVWIASFDDGCGNWIQLVQVELY